MNYFNKEINIKVNKYGAIYNMAQTLYRLDIISENELQDIWKYNWVHFNPY